MEVVGIVLSGYERANFEAQKDGSLRTHSVRSIRGGKGGNWPRLKSTTEVTTYGPARYLLLEYYGNMTLQQCHTPLKHRGEIQDDGSTVYCIMSYFPRPIRLRSKALGPKGTKVYVVSGLRTLAIILLKCC